MNDPRHYLRKQSSLFLLTLVLVTTGHSIVLAQWHQTNGPYGGSVNNIAVFGDTTFVGTDGGIFRSIGSAYQWSRMSVDYVPASNVYKFMGRWGRRLVASGSSSYTSIDDGASWVKESPVTDATFLSVRGTNLFGMSGLTLKLLTGEHRHWIDIAQGLFPSSQILQKVTSNDSLLYVSVVNEGAWKRRSSELPLSTNVALPTSPIDIGDVPVGNTVNRLLTITNTGLDTLIVHGYETSSDDSRSPASHGRWHRVRRRSTRSFFVPSSRVKWTLVSCSQPLHPPARIRCLSPAPAAELCCRLTDHSWNSGRNSEHIRMY